jgi:hypothetical protein
MYGIQHIRSRLDGPSTIGHDPDAPARLHYGVYLSWDMHRHLAAHNEDESHTQGHTRSPFPRRNMTVIDGPTRIGLVIWQKINTDTLVPVP